MIPAGYLLKRVKRPPGWLKVPHVADICSVSDCVNEDVVDIEGVWQHNSFGVANDAEVLWRLVREGNIDASGAKLFFYEAYAQEMYSDGWLFSPKDWRPLSPVASGNAEAAPARAPGKTTLIGYDVVVFGDYLEHSPLSCNHIAESVPVNEHCLLATLQEARTAVETGLFEGCEDGTYKIYSVSVVDEDIDLSEASSL